MKKRMKSAFKNFMEILKKPEMSILPGQIAFYFLMSIVPIIAICAFIASYITISFDLVNVLKGTMPNALAEILISLTNSSTYDNVAILLLCYILLASNGPGSIIIASNALYGIEQPSYLRLKVKSVLMILIIVILLLFIVIIPLFGQVIIKYIFHLLNATSVFEDYRFLYKIVSIFGSFIIIYFNIKLLYTLAPDKKIKSSETTFGSLFTAFSWMVVTELFGFYITRIAKYDVMYGNFANILILLLWLYFLAYFFVMGMAINVRRYQK